MKQLSDLEKQVEEAKAIVELKHFMKDHSYLEITEELLEANNNLLAEVTSGKCDKFLIETASVSLWKFGELIKLLKPLYITEGLL